MAMNFDKVPGWVAWVAQDADGTWHPQGAGRGCKAAEALKDSDSLRAESACEIVCGNSHALGLRGRTQQTGHGWYENEVGRIVRLGQTAPPADGEATLTAWPRRD